MVLVALLLNPALALGGLARVEEEPLTLEEVKRVAGLKVKEVASLKEEKVDSLKEEKMASLKEEVTKVAEAETAILVKGNQGRPCILKPDLEGGWKKLCAVFWKPGGQYFLFSRN